MKRFFYYPIVACAFGALAACNGQKQAEDPTAGIRLANMDTTAKCGTEFYEYACGGWMKAHPLTGEYSSFGTFDMLRENNLKQLQDLITEIAKGKHEHCGSEDRRPLQHGYGQREEKCRWHEADKGVL